MFMNRIDKVTKRADLQQISSFFLRGTEDTEITDKPYYDRLEDCDNSFINMIKSKITCSEYELLKKEFYSTIDVHEKVYLEIGMQVGIKLARQILNINEMEK